MTSPSTLNRATERAEVLARADADELRSIAERAVRRPWVQARLVVTTPPRTGTVAMTVREPVCRERFQLGDVVATVAEVALAGGRGWSMRLGSDRSAVLAAAICDAIVAAVDGETASALIDPSDRQDIAGGVLSEIADAIRDLCNRTLERQVLADAHEWSELAPTIVDFEELD